MTMTRSKTARRFLAGRELIAGPLRIGVVVGSTRVPFWAFKTVQELIQSATTDVAVVVTCRAQETPRAGSAPLRLYSSLDSILFPPRVDAEEATVLGTLIRGTRRMHLEMEWHDGHFSFLERAFDRLRALQLDLLVILGPAPPHVSLGSVTAFGALFPSELSTLRRNATPAGVWEVLESRPLTRTTLNALVQTRPTPVALRASLGPTQRRSMGRNRSNMLLRIPSMICHEVEELWVNRRDPSERSFVRANRPREARAEDPRALPSAATLMRAAARDLAAGALERARALLWRKQWCLAYQFGTPQFPPSDSVTWRTLVPPADRFWADPFPVSHNGRHFLFFEEFVHAIGKGHICVAEVDAAGIVGTSEVIVAEKTHVSYPHIFSWHGTYYMLVESSVRRQIAAYRCVEFPGKWHHHAILLEGIRAADPTLVQIGDTWWLFACVGPEGTENVDALHIYYADNPFGPFHAHEQNPVKRDARSSRPAGALFEHNGSFYRPAQDCSEGYGHAITVQRVITLTPTSFEEIEAFRIGPRIEANVSATHTYNQNPSMSVVDQNVVRWRSTG